MAYAIVDIPIFDGAVDDSAGASTETTLKVVGCRGASFLVVHLYNDTSGGHNGIAASTITTVTPFYANYKADGVTELASTSTDADVLVTKDITKIQGQNIDKGRYAHWYPTLARDIATLEFDVFWLQFTKNGTQANVTWVTAWARLYFLYEAIRSGVYASVAAAPGGAGNAKLRAL